MVLSQDQNAGRNNQIKTDNSSCERVENLKYLGTTITNQKSIQLEIKRRLKSGNACNPAVQDILSSSLLHENIKLTIQRTIIFHVF
jgi:hypothetical protein